MFAANVAESAVQTTFTFDMGHIPADVVIEEVQYERCGALVAAELENIKKMDPREVAPALMAVFKKYANVKTLKSLWDGEGDLDIYFVEQCMLNAFGELGSGSFSGGYELSPGWVIKINNQCKDDSPRDAGFDWLVCCTKMQDNQFVPKIASIAQEDFLYIAVVERMYMIEHYDAVPDGFCLSDLAEHFGPGFEAFDVNTYIEEFADNDDYAMFVDMLRHSTKDLIQLAHTFEQCRFATNATVDFHEENILRSPDRPFVINDPLSFADSGSLRAGSSFQWSAVNV